MPASRRSPEETAFFEPTFQRSSQNTAFFTPKLDKFSVVQAQRKAPEANTGVENTPMEVRRSPDSLQNAGPPVENETTLGAPNDRFEREADVVADQVLRRMEDGRVHQHSDTPAIQSTCATGSGNGGSVHRPGALGSERPDIQAMSDRAKAPERSAERAAQAVTGGGRPMSKYDRARYEPLFGYDFSHVRIHDGPSAQDAARGIRARAYTLGNNIAFASGQYAPETMAGKRLIAHELTHTIQQGRGIRAAVQRAEDTNEREASEVAEESTLERGEESLPAATPPSRSAQPGLAAGEPASAQEATTSQTSADVAGVTADIAEPGEAPSQRSESYTINNHQAWVRDAPESANSHVRRALTINNRQAYLRDAENLSRIIEPGESAAALPAGTTLRGTRLTLPLGTVVKQIDERDYEGRRYVHLEWGEGDGWLRSGNTTAKVVSIPKGTTVDRLAEQGEFTRVRWAGYEGWTAPSNLDIEVWDLTYATRFQSEAKLGLETTAPRDTRLRFEEDGTLKLGRVSKQRANKRNAENLSQWLPDTLDPNTRCLVLEQRGRYLRVLDYEGTWDAESSPPGWWTAASNITRFAGRVNMDEISNDVVRDYIAANQTERSAADTDIRVEELRATGQRVGRVRSDRAIVRDGDGNPMDAKLPYPSLVLALEDKVLPAGAPTERITRVFPLDGDSEEDAVWTAAVNLRFWHSEAGYTVEQEEDQLYLVMRMKQGATRNDRFPISQVAASKLEQAYAGAIDRLIASRTYTQSQRQLLEEAKAFAASGGSQAVDAPELDIPAHAIRDPGGKDDGLRLNADLIRRMKLFYRFIQHKGLIAGPPKSVGGIRARTVAHELSTKWTLNPSSGHLKHANQRLEFARRLVSLAGEPDISGIHWLPPSDVELLAEAVWIIDHPDEYNSSALFAGDLFYAQSLYEENEGRWFDLILSAFQESTPAEPTPEESQVCEQNIEQEEAVQRAHQLVDDQVQVARQRLTQVGNNQTQGAQAAEGYPKEEAWTRRRPNVNDRTGISNHCGGEAIDVTFPFVFNYYDPIIDAIALYFGLYRPVKDSRGSPEHWHYERVGTSPGQRNELEPTINVEGGGE